MDDETADIRRRISEAKMMERRLAEMRDRIRRQHDELESAIRTINDDRGAHVPTNDDPDDPRSRT